MELHELMKGYAGEGNRVGIKWEETERGRKRAGHRQKGTSQYVFG